SCSATPAPSTGAWPGKTSSSPNGSTTAAEPSEMIADVAFDAPVTHPFSYRVPEGWPLAPGQRVLAPLRGAVRVGMVVALREADAGARWAERLAKLDRVVRLDSGVDEAARAQAWRQLADGSARLATGTRSALLAPVAPSGTLVLLDEHEVAHKPPGPPRIHSREVVLERATRESLTLLLTSATPSTEMWWRASGGGADTAPAPPGPWPAVSLADTRTVLRREPLTPA